MARSIEKQNEKNASPTLFWLVMLFLGWSSLRSIAAEGSSSAVNELAKVFDVRQFGARGDGRTLNTGAIQQALDECDKVGGGLVRIPGGTYLSKPIFLGNNTTLQLDAGAVLQATDEPADFVNPQKPGSFVGFVNGKDLLHIAIVGPGRIDGAGIRWWVAAELAERRNPGSAPPQPFLIVLTNCKHVRLQDLTLQNSPSFHLVPTECDDVVVTNVTIRAPSDSTNTVAMCVNRCKNVLIARCLTDVGDDNISIKSGRAVPGRVFACENITVTDCTFLRGFGLSIGGETVGGVRNVTVQHCTFDGTANGLWIKSRRGKGGIVENISYRDINMKNVDPAVMFTCYYRTNTQKDAALPLDSTTPIYRNIRISNLTANCRNSAGTIIGLPESPVTNVVLENVRIAAGTTGFVLKNAGGIQLKNVQVTAAMGPSFLLEKAQVEGLEDPKTALKP